MIRFAEAKDLTWVASMTFEALKEMGQEPDFRLVLKTVIEGHKKAPCLILGDYGVAGFTTHKDYWSEENLMTDYIFYLKPQHRNIKNLKALTSKAQDVADKHNITLRIHYNGTRLNAMQRLMVFCGFTVKGFIGEYK